MRLPSALLAEGSVLLAQGQQENMFTPPNTSIVSAAMPGALRQHLEIAPSARLIRATGILGHPRIGAPLASQYLSGDKREPDFGIGKPIKYY